MRACASPSMTARAVTNLSRSSSDADPSSLQGGRCSATSITPSETVQDKALPPDRLRVFGSTLSSCTLATFVAEALLALTTLPASRCTCPRSHSSCGPKSRLVCISRSQSSIHFQRRRHPVSRGTPAPACSVAILDLPCPAPLAPSQTSRLQSQAGRDIPDRSRLRSPDAPPARSSQSHSQSVPATLCAPSPARLDS